MTCFLFVYIHARNNISDRGYLSDLKNRLFMNCAYITLLTGKEYLPGALTLGRTLKQDIKTKYPLAILLDSSKLDKHQIQMIEKVYDDVIFVDDGILESPIDKLSAQLNRMELKITYTKILLWNQTQYDRLVYLDCDILPLQSSDDLFEVPLLKEQVAACPDSGWPDIFNSGVMVLLPDKTTYENLLAFASNEKNTFDGADQGLFNEWFNIGTAGRNWRRLPFLYNVTFSQSYQYRPAFTRFFDSIRYIHYIGENKPWNSLSFDSSHELWWTMFNKFFSGDEKQFILESIKDNTFAKSLNKFTLEHKNAWEAKSNEHVPRGEIKSIFPWEEREKVSPSRVFD